MLSDTPVCDFGWKACDFTLSDPNGRLFRRAEVMGRKGLLIAFICNHCPYVKRIAERMAEDLNILQNEGVGVVAIMSNDFDRFPDDSPDNMLRFAEVYGFSFPYLVDGDQSVARAYGAVCTPDFFGFNSQGELQYRGRFENPMSGARDLRDAMLGVARTGKGPEDQTASMGCSIKWR